MPQPLSRIVNQLKSEPSRTGSLIITVFGDAIVPRGGSVWLGSLLAFFEGLAIDGSVVRTAMSRLTAEGWFERSKSGRHSFYRLTRRGEQTFAGATRHIYDSPPAEWNGSFELLLLGCADDREQARTVLRDAGFGSPLPGVFVAPSSIAVPDAVEGAIRLQASAGSDMARRLVAESWALERTAEAYRKFSASFAPLKSSIERGEALSDGQAFTARVLLIHHYRRIVLRDPLLPAELLPGNWPGRQARALCGEIYRLLLPGSERWLDAHAINEAGPLPAAAAALLRRFADVDEAP